MRPDREGAFALLRAERPIVWHQHDFCGAGFWALIKHADIVTVSAMRRPSIRPTGSMWAISRTCWRR